MTAPNTTPGPWRVSDMKPTKTRGIDIIGGYSALVANVPVPPDYMASHSLAYPNAHLIAAAPELYEALEWLARESDRWSGQIEPPPPSLANAWAILAKARGEA